ncbi:MAG: GNAT family N-acetyltransferase [Dysgonamonadaceae bacterium]|jgi:GNAT superfamily N-acetyltransferase|nr:GNAT family N-acetyltransferase [Dysgonamonadaceae bacterium]
MMRFGKEKDKEALKTMWKLCFPDDSDEFIAFYFDRVYSNEETIVYVEDNIPVASLQMIPYLLKTGYSASPAAYISGAMTHPEFRQRGFMSRLLCASFEIMKAKGYVYTFLIPQEEWLFGFYEKWGYVKAFPESILYLTSDFPPQKEDVAVYDNLQDAMDNFEILWDIYIRFLLEQSNIVLKTQSQFAHILWDFFNSRGVLFAGSAGLAFTFPEGNQIVVKEFFYRGEVVRQAFLHSIQTCYNLKELVIFDVPDAPFVRNKGMIKRLNNREEVITGIRAGMMLDY